MEIKSQFIIIGVLSYFVIFFHVFNKFRVLLREHSLIKYDTMCMHWLDGVSPSFFITIRGLWDTFLILTYF